MSDPFFDQHYNDGMRPFEQVALCLLVSLHAAAAFVPQTQRCLVPGRCRATETSEDEAPASKGPPKQKGDFEITTLPAYLLRMAEAGDPMGFVHSYFKLTDMDKALPIMEEFEAMAKGMMLPHSMWTRNGNMLSFRSSIKDVKYPSDLLVPGVFKRTMALMDKLVKAAAAEIERVEVFGPEPMDEILSNKKYGEKKAHAGYYQEVEDGFFSNVDLGVPFPDTLVTVSQQFTIKNEGEARAMAKKIIEATRSESGCLFSGWHAGEGKFSCNSGFKDGAAVDVHLKNVEGPMKAMLAGAASLDKMELHGSDKELSASRAAVNKLKGLVQGAKVQEFSSDSAKTK